MDHDDDMEYNDDDDDNEDGLKGRGLHTRKESLKEAISKRPTKSDLANLGYIDDSGMAPRLQPTALRLDRRLTERKSRDDLVLSGIIPLENGDKNGNDEELNDEKKKRKKKVKEIVGVKNMKKRHRSYGRMLKKKNQNLPNRVNHPQINYLRMYQNLDIALVIESV
eukprot:317066_1